MSAADLHVVAAPDRRLTAELFQRVQSQHHHIARNAWIGALVCEFTNDQIHLLAELGYLSIADVLKLRSLGLLASDEGWVGGPL